ncbi:MAG: M23 family metallopeptidase [Oscillospiraceae bacterium]|nr:M23 family metallopeptidase [Oscillospiraceae bacterium]
MKRYLFVIIASCLLLLASCETQSDAAVSGGLKASAPPETPVFAVSAEITLAGNETGRMDPNTILSLLDFEGAAVPKPEGADIYTLDVNVAYSDGASEAYSLLADPYGVEVWLEDAAGCKKLESASAAVIFQNSVFDTLYISDALNTSASFLDIEIPLEGVAVSAPPGHTVLKQIETPPLTVYVEAIEDFTPVLSLPAKSMEMLVLDREGAVPDHYSPGEYSCKIEAAFSGEDWSGTLTYALTLCIAEPPEIKLSKTSAGQGEAITAVIDNAVAYAEYTLYISHLDMTVPCFNAHSPDGGGTVAVGFIQINITSPLGAHTATLKRSKFGGEAETVTTVGYEVTKTEFKRQDMTTTAETQALFTNANLASDNQRADAARSNGSPLPYFTGLFIRPIEGPLTTEFAQTRYVNGKLQSRHTGLDIAADEGAPILAAARGRVVFADDFIVNGRTIIIDHGGGIFTSYSHMSALIAEEGDIVEQGSEIGLVGSTGYSTGPHLHYTVMINGYYIDPAFPEANELLAGI